MDHKLRAQLKKQLVEMRDAIVNEGDADIAPNRVDASTSLDEDAKALNEMSQIIASRQNRSRAGSLGQIESALARLCATPEDFGLCLECEEPISHKRLELMPFVELCVACQSKREDPRGKARRNLTDYIG